MRVLIVDDETRARSLLKTIVTENCPKVTELFEAEDLAAGVASINKNKIDLVFLDVEMPGYAGTQLLDFFDPEDINFEIVFTTAYSEYALKAFD
ncbi:MAG: response regulator, partial [Flavobacteriales bacterium]|nr:response regulator [Flavobacteriales bacterium]